MFSQLNMSLCEFVANSINESSPFHLVCLCILHLNIWYCYVIKRGLLSLMPVIKLSVKVINKYENLHSQTICASKWAHKLQWDKRTNYLRAATHEKQSIFIFFVLLWCFLQIVVLFNYCVCFSVQLTSSVISHNSNYWFIFREESHDNYILLFLKNAN